MSIENIVKYFNFIAAILLSLLYATGKISPSEKYNLWFTIFIIPIAMVFNTVLPIVSLILKKKSSLFYIIPMVIGVPYMLSTVGLKGYFKSGGKKGESFTVLNYNIANITVKPLSFSNPDSARLVLRNFILKPETDVQCYQEFINLPWSKAYNILALLEKEKLNFYFSMEEDTSHVEYSRAGTLIVTKHPIISHGDILASSNGFNRVSYADVKIREDTVRIVNVHLESMGLGQHDPRNTSDLQSAEDATLTILSKLKVGVFERSKQVKEVAEFVSRSPYPVICAGDFNDMPYSYSYQYLKKSMKNAFEETGTGMGFTYNGSTLRMLRIDNQFYSGGVRSLEFRTRDDINFTDHFPVEGRYEIDHD